MKSILPIILSLLLIACGAIDRTNYSFYCDRDTMMDEGCKILQTSLDQWNKTCHLHLTTVEEYRSGDNQNAIMVRLTDDIPPPFGAVETETWLAWADEIKTTSRFYDQPSILTHEIGHALGLPHLKSGVMTAKIADPNFIDHPTEIDCEALKATWNKPGPFNGGN